ncbi:MAG: diguanylate cyclase [Oceanospirillaceae bacterium]|nr:diguanylate cyclase [Oceanospirillaceae bacterium]
MNEKSSTKSSAKYSLKANFLFYLTLLALISLSLGTFDTYRVAKEEIKQQLLSRAQLLASAIHHASMIADEKSELEHVAAQVMIDNPVIESLIILSNTGEKVLFEMHSKAHSYELAEQLKNLGQLAARENNFVAHYLSEDNLFVYVPVEIKLHDSEHKAHQHAQHMSQPTVNLSANSDPDIHQMRVEPIGVVLLTFEKSAISNGVNPILLRILPTSLIGIITMLILCYLLLHIQVLKPIGGIRKAMIKQQSGDHSARAIPHNTIEINDMALSLNHMLDTIREREIQIKKLAVTDSLTGLVNRREFHDQLQIALDNARSSGTNFAVAYIDLDRFKSVNDTHGHQVGDAILKSVAQVLQKETRPYDTVARLGGDEFAIIAIGISQIKGIKNRLISIIENVANTYELEKYDTTIGASIGIAFYPTDATAGDDLIAKADAALYRAKKSGRGTYCIYDREFST